jgi:hypothetical protein
LRRRRWWWWWKEEEEEFVILSTPLLNLTPLFFLFIFARIWWI